MPGTKTYTITEPAVIGWDLTSIVCDNNGGTSSFAYGISGGVAFTAGDTYVEIALAAGDAAGCTFTNTERGTIDIVKTTDGGDGTFTFTDDIPASGGFTIETSVDDTETFNNVVPGTYTVTETVPATGWDLTGIACTSTGGSTFTYTGFNADPAFQQGDNTANITLAAGDDTVSCDFTNTERGTIDIVKTTDGGDGTFTFTDDIPASGGFTIETSVDDTETFNNVVPDTYTVTETSQVGWDLTGIACTSTGGSTFTYTGFNADPAFQEGDNTANITLAAGDDTVSCDFTNTERGTIDITKTTIGGNGAFDFTHNIVADPVVASPATLTTPTTPTQTFTEVIPGTYTVTETVPATGWDLTNIVCPAVGTSSFKILGAVAGTDGYEVGDTYVEITLGAGDAAGCTFTNTERGTIDITKTTIGGNGAFDFTHNIVADPVVASPATLTTPTTPTQTFTEVIPGTYTVTETVPATGWDLTNIVCPAVGTSSFKILGAVAGTDGYEAGDTYVEITLGAGDAAGCTFTNTERGTIDITKTTIGGNGAFDFTHNIVADPVVASPATLTTPTTPTQTFTEVIPGTYTVTETVPATGWDLTGIACTSTGGSTFTYTGFNADPAFQQGDNTANITLAAGDDTVSCDFTNTERGTIDIVKTTDGGDGTFTFTDDIPASGGFTIETSVDDTETFNNVVPDTYTVTETSQVGWDLTGIACTSTGGSTFTYTGFNADPAFQEGDNTANITLAAGDDTVSCDFTNTERGTIDITKTTIGGNGAFDFTHNIVADPVVASPATLTTPTTPTQTFTEVIPGTYTVTETVPATGWDLTGIACTSTGGSTFTYTGFNADPAFQQGDNTANITLAAGDDTVSCDFTNIAQGMIEIVKDTVPDDAQDFSFNHDIVAVPAVGSPVTLDDDADGANSNTQIFQSVAPGTYTVTETPVTGWDLTAIECSGTATVTYTGATPGTDAFEQGDTSANITFAAATDTASCVFTNVERGNITIIEDEDTLPVAGQNFLFSEDITPGTFQLDDDAELSLPDFKNFLDVVPGPRVITQTVEAGWDLISIACTSSGDSTFTYTGAAGGTDAFELGDYTANIELAPGDDDVSCTFRNDNKGTIDIVQDALGDDDNVFAFADNVPTGAGTFDLDGNATTNTETFESVVPGTYFVTETVPATGWDLTDIACTTSGFTTFTYTGNGGTDTADFEPGDTTANITLAGADDSVSCTFTNTERGTINIVKDSDPDDAQAFDFTDNVPGSAGTFTLIDDGIADSTETFTNVLPDTYTVTETPVPAGWDLTDITCDDNNSSGVTATGVATINVEPGETVTCTYTNTKRGNIIVEKQTLPDGDTATFGFTGAVTATLADGESSTPVEVLPGEHAVTETVTKGWDLTDITCDDANSTGVVATGVATFNVEPGETVTCTYTNTKDAFIIVDKVTDPAGDTAEFDFNASWDEGDSPDFSLTDTAEPNNSGDLDPGTYSVAELAEDGWDLTSTTCVSSIDDAETADNIELDPGETVTCTFTNTKRGTINIVQDANPNDAQAFDFTDNIPGSAGSFSLVDDGVADNIETFDNVLPDAYTVTETGPTPAFDLTGLSCVDSDTGGTNSSGVTATGIATINVDPGETVTCTYTNTKRGNIIVEKQTLPDGDAATFAFGGAVTATLADGETSTPVEVLPGVHTVTETVTDGWDLTGIACDDANSTGVTTTGIATFNVEPGETVTCTYTNTKDGSITIVKDADPADDTLFGFDSNELGSFVLSDPTAASEVFSGLQPDTYDFAEAPFELYSEAFTGAELDALVGTEATYPNADQTVVNASSLTLSGAGEGAVMLRLPIFAAGDLSDVDGLVFTIAADWIPISSDNDLSIVISDGTTAIGAMQGDQNTSWPVDAANSGTCLADPCWGPLLLRTRSGAELRPTDHVRDQQDG